MLRRGSAWVLVAAVTAAVNARPAAAQEEPSEPMPEAAPAPAPAPAPESIDPRDPAWSLYHSAFSALTKGDSQAARSRLEELVRRYPDHPAAVRAIEALGLIGGRTTPLVPHPPGGPIDQPVDLRHEAKSKTARGELALLQTIHGMFVGGELCIILECNEAAAAVGLVLLGATAGVTASILSTKEGITPGQRATANSGTLWGAWNGAMILSLMAIDDGDTDPTAGTLVLLGSQLAGLGAGIAAGQRLRPTDGQVALANTVGIWTGVITLLGYETFEIDFSSRQLLTALLVTTDVAFVGGAFLAKKVPMSRSRTLVIDAGGIVGVFAGMGLVTLIQGDERDANLFFGSAMAGSVIGLATATWFTRRWDF